MSSVRLEGLDHTIQITHVWINDLDQRLGWNNTQRTYRLLKSVLHAIRDWLQPNEAVDLGAQMPTLLRGVYYEQWRPAATPVKQRTKADFLHRVEASFKQDPLAQPAREIMCVLALLSDKITGGEIADVRRALPEDVRTLWPERYTEAGAVR